MANPKARRAGALVLSSLAVTMVVGAAGLAAYPFFTDWRAESRQSTLQVEFSSKATRELYRTRAVEVGKPLTRILIPKLGVDTVVVEGVSAKALAAGAGHYQMTPLPGETGNVAIAGHRTMYGKPFAGLDLLGVGDKVELFTPLARHTYEVTRAPFVIDQNDWSVIEASSEPLLTLTTCHPKGSSKQRLVVRAGLVSSQPVGPGGPGA
ncbi:MAG: sortase [Actinomycetota bacterium]